jgi:hypothetical protein
MAKTSKIVLQLEEAELGASAEELARIIMARIGLDPRKRGSTDAMYRTLLEFYERAKQANQHKDQKKAVMTVEEMAMHAKITRQTMYEYLQRWLLINLISKVSFIDDDGTVIIGYRLNGSTLEDAFKRVKTQVVKHLDTTERYIIELQKTIKNEKIAAKMRQNRASEEESESMDA